MNKKHRYFVSYQWQNFKVNGINNMDIELDHPITGMDSINEITDEVERHLKSKGLKGTRVKILYWTKWEDEE